MRMLFSMETRRAGAGNPEREIQNGLDLRQAPGPKWVFEKAITPWTTVSL